MRTILSIAFILFSITLLKGADGPGDYMRLVEQYERSANQSNWQEADDYLCRAIACDPDNPQNALLMSNLGMIRFYAGQDSLALATLNRAVSMAPASVTLLGNRARVLTALGFPAEAIRDYNTLESLDSTYTAPYLYRGLIYLYTGMLDEATPNLEKLRELDDSSVDACIALASYFTVIEKPEEAIPYYNNLINAEPAAEYYAGRARCLLAKDALLDAAEDIASGLELDPDFSELYVCRAILNKKRSRMDDALTDGNRAIQLGADRHYVYRLLGLDG